MNVISSGDQEKLSLILNRIDAVLLLHKYIAADWPNTEKQVDLFELRQEVITSLTHGSELEEEDLYTSLATRDFIAAKPLFIKVI